LFHFATAIFFSEASIATRSAPMRLNGSEINPPPQPISRIFNSENGFKDF
jgi:hypothetical protein